MFLAAVSRPRYDHHKKQYFDGKIGMWPFVKTVQAKRSSKNRAKGTPVMVLQNVDTAAYRDMILHNVVPAILAKMPRDIAIVKLQQDNASPHRCICNAQLRDHGIMNIEVVNQPANSPDFNVLDLGIFNSIQKLQQRRSSRNIDELILAVESAFRELPVDTIGKCFITLQKVMELSIQDNGGNDYKLPLLRKDATKMQLASFNLECDPSVYSHGLELLHCPNQVDI
ncbi:hypothetical protein LEN26_013025 [Aphanomyces euteiches]|nr:hypothetical protein LEN26_013025 [Aphanomyces euteiches]